MAYRDLREWISRLEEESELKRVKASVDWDEEIGAVVSAVFGLKEKGPALLFENIKSYETGACTRLFTASMGNYARIALMLGKPKDTHPRDLVQVVRQAAKNPVKPVTVATGPVKENIKTGDQVNILEFPAPKWHEKDGGRYISTFCGIVVKDPDTGVTNIGLYRGMVIDRQTVAWALLAGKHWGHVYHKYVAMNKPMPMAVVIGWDPVLPFSACAPHPAGVSEYEVMGALRGAPVELVKCESVDIEVPASAEIVLEGHMPPDPESYCMEGPFGEFPGYYAGVATRRPVMKIEVVSHRDNPIFQGTLEGPPINEDHRCSSISMSAIAWDALERNGVPGITDVFSPPSGCFGTNIRVQINKRYQGHAKQVACCLWGMNAVTNFKNVWVVDDDIDIYDNDAVEWAFTYRVNAKEDDIVVMPGCPGSPLDPSNDPQWQDPVLYGGGRWNRLLIDCTRDWKWGPRADWWGERFPPVASPSDAMKVQVEKRWKEYGF